MRQLVLIAMSFLLLAAVPAPSQVQTKLLEYEHDGKVFEGYLAWDPAQPGPRPGVLIIHQWTGISEHERDVANRLAQLGYVALAADIYGKGIRPSWEEAGAVSAQFRDDRALFRQRLQLGLDTLKAQPNVDATKTAAIGYCFGGTGALELARSGADVNGVVSFHGGLSTPNPDDAMNIRAKVLVCHGADDPLVPHDEVVAFMEEMSNGEVDCQFIAYTGAVHSFTDKGADGSRTAAAKYHEPSDRRSWQAMRTFFDEVFGRMPRY